VCYNRGVKILVPAGAVDTRARPPAPRRGTLAGARIGILDNSKPNAGVLLERVAELVAGRTGAAVAGRWTKPGSSRPATMIEEITASVDVVLTGSAD
jgi:hypothetical protein